MSPRLLRADLGRADEPATPTIPRTASPSRMAISLRYLYQKTCASSAGSVVASFAIGMRICSGRVYATRPGAAQDRYFSSFRNRNKIGIVVRTPTAREGQTGAASFIFFQTVAEEKTNPHPSAPRVIAMSPISGSAKVMRFAVMLINFYSPSLICVR